MAATTAARTPDRHSPFPAQQIMHDRSPVRRTASPLPPSLPRSPSPAVAAPRAPAEDLAPPTTSVSVPVPDDEDDPSSSGDIIDMETFEQLLELEEDDSYDFSLGMTQEYFQQALTAFADMDAALAAKDLKKLSDLGHFLKGSSAALGIRKVRESCEKMQNYGKLHDGHDRKFTEAEALDRITALLARVKREYAEAETYLKKWYSEHGASL
ncbi:histidine-phosphotransfer domain, HPT domain-containing protein [Auricularia subglabra TFB-10046 SS5]|nr:histidine-phosphotransfer domain, HPT domain-containing protein [Auricularia subglabra TFB-10046 SS5]